MDTADKTYFVDTTALNTILEFYPAGEFPEVWDTLADLAKKGRLQSPAQVLDELRAKADADLVAWAESNPALFHDLDAEQTGLARQIKERYRKLFEEDEEKSDSSPYVIALAAARRARGDKTNRDYAVVANGPLSSRFELIDICEDPAYDIDFMSHPYMLREIDRNIPVRPRGIVELWGMWKDLDITEEEIEASRITFKGAVR